MKRLLLAIDLHILGYSFLFSLLFMGTISLITFAPGSPGVIPTLLVGIVPLLVIFFPSVLKGTIRQETKRDAVTYFILNTLIVLIFGSICGMTLYGTIPPENTSVEPFPESLPKTLPQQSGYTMTQGIRPC